MLVEAIKKKKLGLNQNNKKKLLCKLNVEHDGQSFFSCGYDNVFFLSKLIKERVRAHIYFTRDNYIKSSQDRSCGKQPKRAAEGKIIIQRIIPINKACDGLLVM